MVPGILISACPITSGQNKAQPRGRATDNNEHTVIPCGWRRGKRPKKKKKHNKGCQFRFSFLHTYRQDQNTGLPMRLSDKFNPFSKIHLASTSCVSKNKNT